MRRTFLARMGALAAGIAAPRVFAQAGGTYPDKPIKVVVAFAPGGGVDPMMRIIQPKMADILGQPIIIENKPGGTSAIGAGYVTKQPSDGYTLLFTAATTHVLHTIDAPHIPYDPMKDFTPISTVSRIGWVLMVHESVPVKTLPEYIAYCKANPNKISFASAGTGNANHLGMERLNYATGIKTVHVPYKAGATATLDLIAGRVQAIFTGISSLLPAVQSGKTRIICYAGVPKGQNIPASMTFGGNGLPEFDGLDTTNIIMGPGNLPAPILAKLSNAVQRTLEMPDIQAQMTAAGQEAYYMPPDALATRMRNELAALKKIIKDANIKLEG